MFRASRKNNGTFVALYKKLERVFIRKEGLAPFVGSLAVWQLIIIMGKES
jgi:hypothetical protein